MNIESRGEVNIILIIIKQLSKTISFLKDHQICWSRQLDFIIIYDFSKYDVDLKMINTPDITMLNQKHCLSTDNHFHSLF